MRAAKSQPTRKLRESLRSIVRSLGMLSQAHPTTGLTNSEVHALIEAEKEGAITPQQIARRLRLEKSSVSRLLEKLRAKGAITISTSERDARSKRVTLSSHGKALVRQIHFEADDLAENALRCLKSSERSQVLRGIELYAAALSKVMGEGYHVE